MQERNPNSNKSNGRWTHEEHLIFLEGLRLHGKNWKKIEQLLQTRTGAQIRSHAQKFFLKIRGPSPSDHQEPSACEVQDEQEEVTLNSKSSSEPTTENEDSYFFSKIIEYSNSKQCFDFWQGLVDCKNNAISKSEKKQANNSFMMYEGGNKIQTIGCKFGNISA